MWNIIGIQIIDKNLLKSDKKLKEQVSKKLKDIGAKTSQGTTTTMQDKYTICGVLSRSLFISFMCPYFTSFLIWH